MQAACGLAQLEKLQKFVQTRKSNFNFLAEQLKPLTDELILPKKTPNSDPSWFGFPITLRNSDKGKNRLQLINYLQDKNIATRLLFGGNLTKPPYFESLKYRVVGDLTNTDQVMKDTFWVGVHPSLDHTKLAFVVDCLKKYSRRKNCQ